MPNYFFLVSQPHLVFWEQVDVHWSGKSTGLAIHRFPEVLTDETGRHTQSVRTTTNEDDACQVRNRRIPHEKWHWFGKDPSKDQRRKLRKVNFVGEITCNTRYSIFKRNSGVLWHRRRHLKASLSEVRWSDVGNRGSWSLHKPDRDIHLQVEDICLLPSGCRPSPRLRDGRVVVAREHPMIGMVGLSTRDKYTTWTQR